MSPGGQGAEVPSPAWGRVGRSQVSTMAVLNRASSPPFCPLHQGTRAWLGTQGRSASHVLCIPSKPVARQRSWAEFRAGKELDLGFLLGGGKAASLPTEPRWSQGSQLSHPDLVASSHRAEWARPQLCGTVPGETDAACTKDLPEEGAACSAWGGKKNAHGQRWPSPAQQS